MVVMPYFLFFNKKKIKQSKTKTFFFFLNLSSEQLWLIGRKGKLTGDFR